MSWPYRPRPGIGNDVVYEKKSLLTWILPHSWGIGFKPYANAASARNRHAMKLNKMCKELEEELHKWAEAGAQVQADRDDLDNHRFDHLGVGDVIYFNAKEVKEMVPYVPEVELKFKKFIQQHKINAILKEYGVKTSEDKRKPFEGPRRPDLMVTTPEGAKRQNIDIDIADHIISYSSKDEKKNSSSKNSEYKQTLARVKQENPKEEWESKSEWNNRCQQLARDELGY